MTIPNTDGVKTNDFPPIKADWYDLTFTEYSYPEDENGNEYSKLVFKIDDSDRLVWCNLSHQEDFIWKVKQFKDAIGMGDKEINLEPYVGTRLKGFLKNRQYEGSNYANVQKFKAREGMANKQPANPGQEQSKNEDNSDLPF